MLKHYNPLIYMAESEGFEPPEGHPSTVFKTAAFDRSASSPKDANITEKFWQLPVLSKKFCNFLSVRC